MQGSLFLACWFRGVLQISSDVQENTIVYAHLHNNDNIAHRYRFKVVLIIDLFVNYRLKRHHKKCQVFLTFTRVLKTFFVHGPVTLIKKAIKNSTE